MRIVESGATLMMVTSDALGVIERAGRTAYKSEGKMGDGTAERFIRMILKRGHESVIEHAYAAFRIVCDRGVSHELVRHRLAAYTQESMRYCDYGAEKHGREISVIMPPGLLGNTEKAWRRACKRAESEYMFMLRNGVKPQIARSVLPTCLKTEVVMTANFREWRHVLRLRVLNEAAHPQIRQALGPILVWFQHNYPVIVEDLVMDQETKEE